MDAIDPMDTRESFPEGPQRPFELEFSPCWLRKLGEKGLVKTWKRRFFNVSPNRERLQYFAAEGDPVPLGFIAFEDIHRAVLVSAQERLVDFHTDSRIWHLQAETLVQAQHLVDRVQAFCLVTHAKSIKPIDIEMRKRGEKGMIKGLKRRYFKQRKDKVYYFKSKREAMELDQTGVAPATALGFIDLNRVVRVRVVDSTSAYQFEVVCTQPERVYELVCDRLREMEQMVKTFTAYAPQIFLKRLKAAGESETVESWNAELIEHSLVLLRVKPGLLNEFIQILFNASTVFDQERVLTVLDFVDRWFSVLSDQNNDSASTNFDMSFFCKALEVVFESYNFTLLMTFIGVLYHHSFFFLEERTRKMLFFDLLVDKYFEELFLSWSLSVTNVYIQLLVFKSLRLPRSSLPSSRETFAPLDSLIDNTVRTKVEHIRLKHKEGAGDAAKLSSPYAYAENALHLWDQFMAEYVDWESNGDVLNKPLPPLRPLGPKPSIAKYGIVAKTPSTATAVEGDAGTAASSSSSSSASPSSMQQQKQEQRQPAPSSKEAPAIAPAATSGPSNAGDSGGSSPPRAKSPRANRPPAPSTTAPVAPLDIVDSVSVVPAQTGQHVSPRGERPSSVSLASPKSQVSPRDRSRSRSAEFQPVVEQQALPLVATTMQKGLNSPSVIVSGPPPPVPSRSGRRQASSVGVDTLTSNMILQPASPPPQRSHSPVTAVANTPTLIQGVKPELPPSVVVPDEERDLDATSNINESLVIVENLSINFE